MKHDIKAQVENEYYAWLIGLVCGKYSNEDTIYSKLLECLHSTPFVYSMERDENRAEDGIDLRYRFECECTGYANADAYIDGPCSVLEMMVALAIRCEENIMDDANIGDRTAQWFWGMVVNLGLGPMTDDRFDERYTNDILDRFLDRDYEPDGRGGLFTVRNCDCDLRYVEIWVQLCWYLDSIT